MHRLRVACLAVLAAILTLPLLADDLITRVTVWQAKPGMEGKLEDGLKRHNAWHQRMSDTMPLATWTIQSGPATGSYVRLAPNRQWKDFDAEAAMSKADAADTAVNTDPYIASGVTSYYRYLPDISRPKDGGPPPMASITFYRVKFGKTDDFTRAATKFHEAIGKTSWPLNYMWYALVNGGEGPEFVLSVPRENWAAFAPLEKPFAKMLEEGLGRADADSALQMFRDAVSSISSQIIEYRSDLSFVPAKK